MPKKSTSATPSRSTVSDTHTTRLTSLEENVVRMRRGYTVPGDQELEQLGAGNPELAAKLAAIEERVFEAVGARNTVTHRRIVDSLRQKGR